MEQPEEWSDGRGPAARRWVMLACLAILLAFVAIVGGGQLAAFLNARGALPVAAAPGPGAPQSPG